METIRFNNGTYTIDLENGGTYFCRISSGSMWWLGEIDKKIPIYSEDGYIYWIAQTTIFTIKNYSKEKHLLYITSFGATFVLNVGCFDLIGV